MGVCIRFVVTFGTVLSRFFHQNGHLILVSFWMDASSQGGVGFLHFASWSNHHLFDGGLTLRFFSPHFEMVIASIFVACCRMRMIRRMMMMMMMMCYMDFVTSLPVSFHHLLKFSWFLLETRSGQHHILIAHESPYLVFKQKGLSLRSTRCSGTILLMNKCLHQLICLYHFSIYLKWFRCRILLTTPTKKKLMVLTWKKSSKFQNSQSSKKVVHPCQMNGFWT